MKQKLALCCALIHFPRILLLDEPTTGVDPVSRAEFWEMLISLKRKGITILVSTPYMDEAGRCDKIALMQEGSFLMIDTPENITSGYDRNLMSVRSDSMYALLKDLRERKEIRSCYSFGDSHHVSLNPGSLSPEDLENYLADKGHRGIEIKTIPAGIEDCFMELTEKGGRD
ncbi:AAA family ATPase [Oceanispirochaeta crateris]|uniref:AAA family ATPase n=1 Tax=Oceanispirochaeta crateris TaxID=2518645 RepID=UPI001AF01555|nr:AAA family ATPase [Oceanispirochaeta crateris]